MADRKQNTEFLGSSPKFNVVGKDNKSAAGMDEPPVPVNQGAYWIRAAVFGVLIVLLAAVLFYLNDRNLGKTEVAPSHGGRVISPDTKNAPPPPNLR